MSITSEVPHAADDARSLARRLADHLRAHPLDVDNLDDFERTAVKSYGFAGVVAQAAAEVARKDREDREAVRARRTANARGPRVVTRFGSQLTTEHDAR